MNREIITNENIKRYRFKDNMPIILILLISAFLNIFMIWKLGFANEYYAAGVYSMGQNMHAFFYNSLDSVGFVTIDKPPLGFWIQVLFTKLFGFNGTALILPQAIASVTSVYLIYCIIKKRFSKGAGLVAAAILALTPIFVAVARNNTIDGILILLLVLASQQALLATEKASTKHLVLAGVFIGLGFSVKMLQAFVIVPAIYLTYLILAKQKFLKKVLVCTISFIIMLVISLSWVIAVDITPEDNRPYVGSSDSNSALDLAIGYNGLNRIIGGGSTGIGDKNNDKVLPNQQNINPNNDSSDNMPNNTRQRPNNNNQNRLNDYRQNTLPFNNNSNISTNRKTGGESGESGIFRLYNEQNAGQISWFLLPSIFTCILLIILVVRKNFRFNPKNITLLFFALSFVPIFIYFSFSSGLAHRYYFATLAPFIAGLVAVGYYHLMKGERYWIPIVFIPICIVQIYIQNLYKGWYGFLIPLCSVIFIISSVTMIVAVVKKAKQGIFAILLSTLLILPAVWSATPMIYNDNSQLPITGPDLVTPDDKFDNEQDLSNLIKYLEKNKNGATYLAMTPSSMDMGAELILQSGEAVMALGGFNGGDNIITIDEFIKMVKNNEVRYAVVSNSNNRNSNAEIYNWIKRNTEIVDASEYGKTRGNFTVYKLN